MGGTGEIVVGELAGRLIDHAAELEPLGEIAITGRQQPVRAFRLRELARVAPAFESRLDAPLVGRTAELAVLRGALKRARQEGSPQAAVVVGSPGVGKSRLAAELVRRARGVTALWGRCLSYGEGITYWPLREAVGEAPPCSERDAVLAALDAEPPPPAGEVAALFRRLCEALARQKPLVVVFDDVHWAEPTFLELVEQLVDRGRGPIVVVCVAREEPGDDGSRLLTDEDGVDRIVLDALTEDETETLVDVLGGTTLESDQRARIVDAGEGNPFFLEQLVALGMEGGLTAHELPATVQALLAARLDRLGPGERAVLERGAVIGKQFRLDDLAALLDPEAVPTAEKHVEVLVARGFVRPVGSEELRFRHVLVQQAVYRAAPKRLRAELHERFVGRFEGRAREIGDTDEFAGYHLEQAHRLRTDLGEGGERTAELARRAGTRLGAAGSAAFRRGDMPATVSLLARAVALLPDGEPMTRRLELDLAIARFARGDISRAIADFTRLIDEAERAGDECIAAWARMERAYAQVRHRQGPTGDDLLAAATAGMPVFEREGEHRAHGRAWLLAGWIHGGHHSDHAAWADAAERALVEYQRADWSVSTCLGEIAAALYWGATPVDRAIARIDELLREHSGEQAGVAYLRTFLGGLVAQRGDFREARALVAEGQATLEELGLRASVLTYGRTVLGDIELLAGEPEAAESVFRALCDDLEESHDFSHLASRASDLAEAVLELGDVDEAESWTHVAERLAADDDNNAQLMWRSIRARIHARRGAFGVAEELAREAVRRADATDDLNRRAEAYRDLGEVLRLAEDPRAAEAYEKALELYELKGNLAGARRARLGGLRRASGASPRRVGPALGRPYARPTERSPSVPGRAAARRVRSERRCEREQSDGEHRERPVHASDLAHRFLLSGCVRAPVTVDLAANRSPTVGKRRGNGREFSAEESRVIP